MRWAIITYIDFSFDFHSLFSYLSYFLWRNSLMCFFLKKISRKLIQIFISTLTFKCFFTHSIDSQLPEYFNFVKNKNKVVFAIKVQNLFYWTKISIQRKYVNKNMSVLQLNTSFSWGKIKIMEKQFSTVKTDTLYELAICR